MTCENKAEMKKSFFFSSKKSTCWALLPMGLNCCNFHNFAVSHLKCTQTNCVLAFINQPTDANPRVDPKPRKLKSIIV